MDDKRDYYVVKSNDFIRNTQIDLSVKQQCLVLYMISLIMPGKEKLRYSFAIKDYLGNEKALGGASYRKVKNDLEKLRNEFIILKNKKEMTRIPIFKELNIPNRSGLVEFMFSKELEPHLYNLSTNYTQYLLSNVQKLTHKHSIVLYEFFKSYENSQEKYKFTVKKHIDDIKFKVNAINKEGYSNFALFYNMVIIPAINEINTHTDISVTIKKIKTGRSVSHLEIRVRNKKENNIQNRNSKYIDFLDDLMDD